MALTTHNLPGGYYVAGPQVQAHKLHTTARGAAQRLFVRGNPAGKVSPHGAILSTMYAAHFAGYHGPQLVLCGHVVRTPSGRVVTHWLW